MKSKIWVIFTKEHPHHGDEGYLDAIDGKVKTWSLGGKLFYRVNLPDCSHGETWCVAQVGHLRRHPTKWEER